ncbi:hypothetical protein DUW02_11555 [Salmonella enterica subsp. enterica serovar Senftenberg]|nr:hypothetical protein [Salmonella enterica subsp. enterica serovar Senftenberg]ECB4820037.1 hypothetical protein [Salmonella enterica subsp. enterica serovar Senftenberg]ECD2841979.1 hypothetical protein [Salmonella enterica subsp. enterica serovar Senftenberg]ECF4111577.1 hypothetical protein [Salmonella enterica subsp. enterica serovar Senftenberg]ECJ7496060.1 hypothetical protein [Salmonella enterica subsp. enterica serovar Senftenberg]
MKLNYFTYRITDNRNQQVYFDNISDIIKNFCLHRKKSLFEKSKGLKRLYLAMPTSFDGIYYLTTPAITPAFKAVDRATGVVNDLASVLGKDSLEKVTYFFIDPKHSIIGVTEGKGNADIDDLQFFINEIINQDFQSHIYTFELCTLKIEIKSTSATKFKLITEARVKLNNDSVGDVINGLFGKEPSDNMEVQIIVKRKDRKENVKDYIQPLLSSLSSSNDKEYAEIYFRAKADEFQSNVKEFILDQNQNIFDIINPHLKAKIEEQILEKRYKNQVVISELSTYAQKFTGRIHSGIIDPVWNDLKTESYHKAKS